MNRLLLRAQIKTFTTVHASTQFLVKTLIATAVAAAVAGCAGNSSSSGSLSAHSSSQGTLTSSQGTVDSSSSTSLMSSSSVPASTSSVSSTSSAVADIGCAWQQITELTAAAKTRIEAELYDTCAASVIDTTPGNSTGELREGDVDIAALNNASNGYFVTEMQAGEHLEYSINVANAGFYQFSLGGMSNTESGIRVTVKSSKASYGSTLTLAMASNWQTQTTDKVYLSNGPQVISIDVENGSGALDFIEAAFAEKAAESPATVVANMGIGINLGNTLDAYPNEGDWAPKAQLQFLEAFASAGFNHVRIPVTWNTHVASEPPYQIDPDFLDRVEQVVDWGLSQDLYVIVNAHHEIWLKENYGVQANRDRFDAIWQQLAERLQHKPPRLMFEILNEPNGMTLSDVEELNDRLLGIIRATNPERIAVFSGNAYTSVSELVKTRVPNDPALIANFHSYDPWPFAGQCTRRWGSDQDLAALAGVYSRAKTWSDTNGVPVMVNEFNAAHYDFTKPENICNESDRLNYLRAHVKNALDNGFAATVWDDGGSFQIYDRIHDRWGDEQPILTSGNR